MVEERLVAKIAVAKVQLTDEVNIVAEIVEVVEEKILSKIVQLVKMAMCRLQRSSGPLVTCDENKIRGEE